MVDCKQLDGAAQLDMGVFSEVCRLADTAGNAQTNLALANGASRNALLCAVADALCQHSKAIENANNADLQRAAVEDMPSGRIDRLRFDKTRILASAQAVRDVAALPDPLGQLVRGLTLRNGLRLNQVRVPIGVFGMIYEARPNVTVDVAALCLKSGNAVLLRGGHEAEATNAAIISAIAQTLSSQGFDPSLVSSVDRFGRMGAKAMMQARGHVDVLVPRGGRALIQSVVRDSKVPVIETGAGNVHIYVDAEADFEKAVDIVLNAKTQRVGVCNAVEKLIIHRDVAEAFLPEVAQRLVERGVTLHADDQAYAVLAQAGCASPSLVHATQDDWDTEYLSYDIGIKVVDSIDQAIAFISQYSTKHTDCIVSEDYSAIEYFTGRVDSAVVMVNASSRFTDGGQFGFGAELGISTQKLHARGPMGLEAMTTTKWIGYGTGQVRQ
jgi:glutamate-5-semialdehyde dehydrogenase